MSLKDYLKDRSLDLMIKAFVFIFIAALLSVLDIGGYAIGFIMSILIGAEWLVFLHSYLRKYHFYKKLAKQYEGLEKKYLLSEVMERPTFEEGVFLYDLFRGTTKSMNDQIALYKYSAKEYREYIETWVHEVKTPIAASRLMLSNHPSSISKSLGEEMDKIEGFVEQALFYSRSSDVEKDYIIKKVNLESLVKASIKKYSRVLIEHKIAIELGGLDYSVYTDSKWMDFILGQVIGNAIKYRSNHPQLSFKAIILENSIVLQIQDNGIGIKETDLSRVFDKGFTGENGRRYSKSTGLGLYLAKKLCSKLGLEIGIQSTEQIGTTISIVFPKSKMHLLVL